MKKKVIFFIFMILFSLNYRLYVEAQQYISAEELYDNFDKYTEKTVVFTFYGKCLGVDSINSCLSGSSSITFDIVIGFKEGGGIKAFQCHYMPMPKAKNISNEICNELMKNMVYPRNTEVHYIVTAMPFFGKYNFKSLLIKDVRIKGD